MCVCVCVCDAASVNLKQVCYKCREKCLRLRVQLLSIRLREGLAQRIDITAAAVKETVGGMEGGREGGRRERD